MTAIDGEDLELAAGHALVDLHGRKLLKVDEPGAHERVIIAFRHTHVTGRDTYVTETHGLAAAFETNARALETHMNPEPSTSAAMKAASTSAQRQYI